MYLVNMNCRVYELLNAYTIVTFARPIKSEHDKVTVLN